MKHAWVFLSLLYSVSVAAAEKIALYALLTPGNETHALYSPSDADIPHPFAFYGDRAKDPVYSYDNARGVCSFLLDLDTNELQYAISYSEMSGRPIMMHFHLGEEGVSGPVIQTVFGEPYTTKAPLGTSAASPLYGKQAPKGRAAFLTGTYKLKGNPALTPPLSVEQEKADLLNGQIYLNIHTYLNEAGEIRGQILRP